MAIEKGHVKAIYNLAVLYKEEFKDYKKAEEYYLMAIEKGNVDALNNLAWLYFIQKKNKQKSLNYSKLAFEQETDLFQIHTYSMILLWNNEVEKAIKISTPLWTDTEMLDNYVPDLTLLLNLLIAKKQYNFVLKIFTDEQYNLKDRFKPVYYALMHFMKDIYPDELNKMGAEMKEVTEKIVAEINKLRKEYA